MYALALDPGSTTAAMPYFHLGAVGPIQSFGIIVAIGVLIGAGVLRRYAEWHGISDDHIRGLTGWVTITGFIGAHIFDVMPKVRGFLNRPSQSNQRSLELREEAMFGSTRIEATKVFLSVKNIDVFSVNPRLNQCFDR
jgi:hypothetical protein